MCNEYLRRWTLSKFIEDYLAIRKCQTYCGVG